MIDASAFRSPSTPRTRSSGSTVPRRGRGGTVGQRDPVRLAAYVFTNDLRRGHRVAHPVEAGMRWLNSHHVRDLRTPFGGGNQSGLGREGGWRSVDFYPEPHIVRVAGGDLPVPRFGS